MVVNYNQHWDMINDYISLNVSQICAFMYLKTVKYAI